MICQNEKKWASIAIASTLLLAVSGAEVAPGAAPAAPVLTRAEQTTPSASWKENFSAPQAEDDGVRLPQNWKVEGTKIGVPDTICTVIPNENGTQNVLQVRSDLSTGGIITNPSTTADLNKTPIMRWRWRVLSLPTGGDGRNKATDDQPVGLYLGVNGAIRKQTISYRWENVTPVGVEGNVSYGGGLVKNHYITIRNHETPIGEWVTETRNVAEDWKKLTGEVPKAFALSVIGNSQYTKSHTKAEIAFIEFISIADLEKIQAAEAAEAAASQTAPPSAEK